MAKELKSLRSPRVAIQEDYLDVATYRRLKTLAPAVHVVLSKGLVERLVEAKEPAEIRSIRAAAQISGQAFEHVLRQIRPGTTELEISAEISFLHKRLGGEADAFEPIVASGRRSSFPHARATSRKISHGDVVLLDFGCVVNGYRSDITRTVFVGKATSRMRRVYSSVLEAHHMAIEQACPFMRAKDLDAVARQHLRQAGIARHFVHSLGHGLGLQVHEGPRISPKSTDILRPGNVVTIEPGVYIPTLGGIRIEDDILITNSGSELLSHANTDLLIL
jgi:Xaa-Pro aminopeptidase